MKSRLLLWLANRVWDLSVTFVDMGLDLAEFYDWLTAEAEGV